MSNFPLYVCFLSPRCFFWSKGMSHAAWAYGYKKKACKKSQATMAYMWLFGSLVWRSVRQSHKMSFLALPLNKSCHEGEFIVMVYSFVCKLISQNEWIFSFLWINAFNVFASGSLLMDWAKGKRQSQGPIVSETSDSASIHSWVSALPFHLGDHSVLPRALCLI